MHERNGENAMQPTAPQARLSRTPMVRPTPSNSVSLLMIGKFAVAVISLHLHMLSLSLIQLSHMQTLWIIDTQAKFISSLRENNVER